MAYEEEQLLRAAVGGDVDALSTLLARHGPDVERSLRINPVWRAALETADVMQVTYLEAFLRIATFDPARGTPFGAWLRRIAENNLRDAIRGLERQKQPQPRDRVYPARSEDSLIGLYNLLGADSSTPSREVRRDEAVRRLEAAIAGLPERYRQVIRLYDLEERSIEEVANRTGRSPGAVHMMRARAHDRLREQLGAASEVL
jgi:RNA polymerase sigma-70 factor (ECF subfamily)